MPHPLLLLIIGSIQYPNVQSVNFSLPKNDIVHTTSGLILHYLSDYKPANNIITFTVTIPMVTDMCYLIPLKSMKKIPQCNQPTGTKDTSRKTNDAQIYNRFIVNSAIHYRRKRLITDIISIGLGSAALTLSTANTIQIANLKSEMNRISSTLSTVTQSVNMHTAQILHLNEGQLKLAHELNYTQAALNRTLDLINEHSDILKTHETALRTLSSLTIFLSNRLSSFIHAVETHFIHTAIDDILANKLNLQFIHHKDLSQVTDLIIKATNVSIDDSNSILSPVELITRLLVQQRIDFISMNRSTNNDDMNIIGQLIFTSFFAAPNPNQAPYSLYELVPVPFNHEQQRVQLAQMPYVIGIEKKAQHFIRWSKAEAISCNFAIMSTCRETPAIRKDLADDCLSEILTDKPLISCRIESHPEPVFVHRVGQHWAISTNTTTKCHPVKFSDTEQMKVIPNKEMILPPVALITITETTSLTCDHFFLPGLPNQIGPTISLIENTTLYPVQNQLLDLQVKLNNNSHWAKLPYIPPNMQALIEFISKTPPSPPIITHFTHYTNMTTFIILALIGVTLGLIVALFYRTRSNRSKKRNLMITLPPIKQVEELTLTNNKI